MTHHRSRRYAIGKWTACQILKKRDWQLYYRGSQIHVSCSRRNQLFFNSDPISLKFRTTQKINNLEKVKRGFAWGNEQVKLKFKSWFVDNRLQKYSGEAQTCPTVLHICNSIIYFGTVMWLNLGNERLLCVRSYLLICTGVNLISHNKKRTKTDWRCFENMILKKILRPKTNWVTVRWSKLHFGQLHIFTVHLILIQLSNQRERHARSPYDALGRKQTYVQNFGWKAAIEKVTRKNLV